MGNGSVIGKRNVPTPALASGVWDMSEVQLARLASIWPGLVVSDSFNRADGGLGSSDSGHVWTTDSGTWSISSNKARMTTSTGNARATVESGVADKRIGADITLDATLAVLGFALRQSGSDYVFLEIARGPSNDAINLRKMVGGSPATFAGPVSTGMTVGGTHLIEVHMVGGAYEVFVDGVSTLTGNDSHISTATRCGMLIDDGLNRNSNTRFDNFVVRT